MHRYPQGGDKGLLAPLRSPILPSMLLDDADESERAGIGPETALTIGLPNGPFRVRMIAHCREVMGSVETAYDVTDDGRWIPVLIVGRDPRGSIITDVILRPAGAIDPEVEELVASRIAAAHLERTRHPERWSARDGPE